MNAAKMAVLSVFWQENGLGPLGVKCPLVLSENAPNFHFSKLQNYTLKMLLSSMFFEH